MAELGTRLGTSWSAYPVIRALVGARTCSNTSLLQKSCDNRDNRPENLELWTRPQPSGIRVSDAIRWAREILDC